MPHKSEEGGEEGKWRKNNLLPSFLPSVGLFGLGGSLFLLPPSSISGSIVAETCALKSR